jgi:D-alanyl-lipoteichoic acid acyltransferase DltB (MBOAT superfamily)
MLFNSFVFIFAFLPLFLLLYHLLVRRNASAAIVFVTLASLAFYAYWNPVYLPVLAGPILLNWLLARRIRAAGERRAATLWLAFAIALNLALLGYFKYAGFFVENLNDWAAADWVVPNIVLPLGISFFTFLQITFLVDVRRGLIGRLDFLDYAAFVTYFPHLIAGPIIHHDEIVPQFRALRRAQGRRPRRLPAYLSAGLTIFAIGLFKKVVIADTMAGYADPAFAGVEQGAGITLLEAWGATLSFTFQIYFDFSGYSDMAIGLAKMMGLRLPANFASPYKAASIIEFWRRWHMTLSRFLRDYLYIPLGGNRQGGPRRYLNLMITMALGGLWHGAAWTFVAWGALHGLYLIVNHAWNGAARALGLRPTAGGPLRLGLARLLTFGAVAVGWTFFRAESFGGATAMLSSMFGGRGLTAPESLKAQLLAVVPAAAHLMERIGFSFTVGPFWGGLYHWALLVMLGYFVLFLPSTQELMRTVRPVLASSFGTAAAGPMHPPRRPLAQGLSRAVAGLVALAWLSTLVADRLSAFVPLALALLGFLAALLIRRYDLALGWRPRVGFAAFFVLAFGLALVQLFAGHATEFIYFQF